MRAETRADAGGDRAVKPRPAVPGERAAQVPSDDDMSRLVRLRPFVRQSGDGWRPPWLLRRRKLLDYLIVYIAAGHGRFTVDGESFPVGPGDVIWIPPDTLHEMEGFAPRMHCIYAHFDLCYDPCRSNWDACIPGGTVSLGPWALLRHPRLDDPVIDAWKGKLAVHNGAAVGALLAAICREHRRLAAAAAVQLGGMLLQLIGLILRGQQPAGRPGPHLDKIQTALGHIREQTDTELDVARLAATVGLSPSHLRRLFRETVGSSPRGVHREARMRKACEMLVYHSRMNISEIAFALGFSTVHNFSRAFRQVTGVSPSEYRLA